MNECDVRMKKRMDDDDDTDHDDNDEDVNGDAITVRLFAVADVA